MPSRRLLRSFENVKRKVCSHPYFGGETIKDPGQKARVHNGNEFPRSLIKSVGGIIIIYSSVLDLIGQTPIVKLNRLRDPNGAELFVKLEGFNPGGSMKDRTAKWLIESAEAAGLIRKGSTIIESSSGNLAIGLALVARVKGYKLICVVDPKISEMNLQLLEALGAEVRMVHQCDEHGNYLAARIELVKQLCESIENAFWTNQYANPANPQAHQFWTAREIYEEFGSDLDWVVVPVGTAGLATGCSMGLKSLIPSIKILCVDAIGSVTFGCKPGKRYLVGIGSAIVPENLKPELYDRVTHVGDYQAFQMCRRLALEEGLLVGGSSGAAIYAALELSKTLSPGQKVLAILPDRGEKYYNTIFSDSWWEKTGISELSTTHL